MPDGKLPNPDEKLPFHSFQKLLSILAFTPSPFHPFTPSPLHPFAPSPFHPFTLSPFHPFTLSPFHPFTPSPHHPITLSPFQSPILRARNSASSRQVLPSGSRDSPSQRNDLGMMSLKDHRILRPSALIPS